MSKENYYRNIKTAKEGFNLWDYPVLGLIRPGSRILELGAGSGYFAEYIMRNMSCETICADISVDNLEQCKKRGLAAVRHNFEVDTLPFQECSFDQIIFVETIEHLFNPLGILGEARRCLKHDGELVLSTHNALNIKRRMAFLFGIVCKTSDISEGAAEHIRLYSHSILSKILRQSGFSSIKFYSWIKVGRYYLEMISPLRSLFSQHILCVAKK
jgi:2-polyprenyl-3-methyl-5-hydroxy-6-metoxy-1,4-benzoquinol methylase